jgi:hypothetical protein
MSVCDVVPKVDTTQSMFHMGLGQVSTLVLAVLVAGVLVFVVRRSSWAGGRR